MASRYNTLSDFEKLMRNYRLITAEIIYHMSDYPGLVQSYIWQELDLVADFPVLKKFLEFWDKILDGKVHSVKTASCDFMSYSDVVAINNEIDLS